MCVMTLKLPSSEELGSASQEFTQEGIEQLIEEAKKWPVENARLLSVLEFMANEMRKYGSQTNTATDTKLAELLSNTPQKLVKEERDALESDLKNWDIKYIENYIENTEAPEKQVLALNVLLRRIDIKDTEITLSPVKWFFYYIWKSWYPIEFQFWPKKIVSGMYCYFAKIGTWDRVTVRLDGFVALIKMSQAIDQNILLTHSLDPLNENQPFKYIDRDKVVFKTSQKNFLGKNKRVTGPRAILHEGYYSKVEHQAIVEYLNSHRRVFSSWVFEKKDQEKGWQQLSQGDDNLMLV